MSCRCRDLAGSSMLCSALLCTFFPFAVSSFQPSLSCPLHDWWICLFIFSFIVWAFSWVLWIRMWKTKAVPPLWVHLVCSSSCFQVGISSPAAPYWSCREVAGWINYLTCTFSVGTILQSLIMAQIMILASEKRKLHLGMAINMQLRRHSFFFPSIFFPQLFLDLNWLNS